MKLMMMIEKLGGYGSWLSKRGMRGTPKVRVTRENLIISMPASMGGQLHLLPRTGQTFEVSASVGAADQYDLRMYQNTPRSSGLVVLGHYASQHDAMDALAGLTRQVTGRPMVKWLLVLVAGLLTWLFATSYLDVVRNGSGGSRNPLSLGALSGATIASDPSPFQSMPSAAADGGADLSNYIFQQAKAAQEKAQRDAPPKTGKDVNTSGLAGFGLKGVDDKGAGEGCDPKLGFKVPEK